MLVTSISSPGPIHKAACGVKCREDVSAVQEEARRRESDRKRGLLPIDNSPMRGRSQKIAAEAVRVGPVSVARALRVERTDPEAFEKIRSGKDNGVGRL